MTTWVICGSRMHWARDDKDDVFETNTVLLNSEEANKDDCGYLKETLAPWFWILVAPDQWAEVFGIIIFWKLHQKIRIR